MEKTVLENGLTIITEQNKNSKVCTIAYLIKSGSFDEDENEHGIAHLIEHMLFKGTLHRNYKQINNDIESVGGYLNAYTNFQSTKFYCTMPSDQWKVGLDVLSDLIFNHTIPEKELEKEKQVVQEELKMYNDDPSSFVNDKLIKNMFDKYPNRQSIGGTIESVGKLTREDILNFINKNYFLENMVVVCTGNINHKNIVDFVNNYINELNIEFESFQKNYKKFTFDNFKDNISNYYKPDVNQTHIAFGLFGPSKSDKDYLPIDLLAIILGGNCSSILYDTIREQKGLAYHISVDVEGLSDVSLIVGYAGLNNDNSNEFIEELDKIINNLKSMINEENVKSAKSYLKGIVYMSMETTSGVNDFIVNQILYNSKNLEDYINYIDKITIQDIMNVIDKYINVKNIKFVKLEKK